ncbi:hypothetical protein AWB76_05998 [Caballeronia temeraria]|uniref:Uncharacterized protein n=1 Tax=Caballeronia temeraria TaxID=1777137 RepID=A0A158CUH4_9BURK|nr:hypothetical protein AWB76_05998 [Caballeronia temeraria]
MQTEKYRGHTLLGGLVWSGLLSTNLLPAL